MDQLKVETLEKKLVVPRGEFGGEQPLDIRVTLPEYLGDAARVLRCSVSAVPDNVSAAGDRLTAEGTVRVRIVYLADKDGLCAYETSEPFTKSVEAQGLSPQSVILPVFRTDKPLCRAVSPRTLEIRAVVRTVFRVFERTERSLLKSADGGGIQLRKTELRTADIENISSKQITVDGVCPLPAEHNAVRRLLCCDAVCRVSETRVITNKAMVRGETEFSLFYLSDASDGPETARVSVPFSEIVECAGLADGMSVSVRPSLLSADASPEGGSDKAREIRCSAVVALTLTAEKLTETAAVTDAYSTAYEIEPSCTTLRAAAESRPVAESMLVEGRIDLSALQPRRILYHTERIGSVRTESAANGVLLRGSLTVGVFAEGQDGAIGYAENDLPFTFEKSLPAQNAEYVFDPLVTVSGAEVSPDGSTAAVRAELFVEGRLDAVRSVPALTSAALREDSPKTAASGLVIYFPSEGEQLWDIAKKYGAPADLLTAENGLTDETVPAGRPLLISRV